MKMKKLVLALAAAAFGLSTLQAQEVKPFKEGDRAVFLGNSITDGGHYHSYIWLYYMTHFPEMPIKVFNGGIGGDTAYDELKRLDNDIFGKKPTVLMVTFGMNDSGYFEYNGDNAQEFADKKLKECTGNFDSMVKRFKEHPEVRMVMIGTSPFDETAKIDANVYKKKNDNMRRIIAYQMDAAKKNGWEQVDFNVPMTEINQREQAKDSTFTLCGNDRVHPGNDGHMVMAYLFLKAQGMAGKPVADVDINATNMTVVKEENCKISDLTKFGDNIKFDYLAKSLPYPLDTIGRGGSNKPQARAMKVIPFMDEMNKEQLKVTGLSGDYKLLIDGEEIGVWSAADLAKGINLAEISLTPQYQQALAVMHLNERRWDIEREFRDFAWCQHGFFQQEGLLNANNREAVKVMDANVDKNIWLKIKRGLYATMMHDAVREGMQDEMDVIVNTIYDINKPVTRRFELRKQ